MPFLRIAGILIFLTFLAGSCRKEQYYTGSTKLMVSEDTVWFDTIFTKEPGSKYPISVTKIFWFKNTEHSKVKASFRLAGGSNSPYRINVDGFAGPEVKDVEIGAKDSVFVFVQCTLEANNQLNPVLVCDSLYSSVNGSEQKTYLAAYGWDAHYYHSVQLPCGETWADKTKPYVIVDNVLVDKGCTFTIREGVKVYNSARSWIVVNGTMNVEGTAANPVAFTGDKPSYAVKESPNQWGGIYLTRGSVSNKFKFASIHNAAIGIRVDSLPESGTWNLELDNTEIMFCGQACVAAITAKVRATNCLLAETGTYSFLGLLGGTYDFRHCTFANFVSYGSRPNGHFALTNVLRDGNGVILRSADLDCNMTNCIVSGSQDEELYTDDKGSALFAVNIKNNMLKSKSRPWSGNFYGTDPMFNSLKLHDFGLASGSPAIDKAWVLSPAVTTDLLGKPRSNPADLGCLERQ